MYSHNIPFWKRNIFQFCFVGSLELEVMALPSVVLEVHPIANFFNHHFRAEGTVIVGPVFAAPSTHHSITVAKVNSSRVREGGSWLRN